MTIEDLHAPGVFVQKVLREDACPPPEVLLHTSTVDMGLADVPKDRYFSREFHDLEMKKLWPRVWQMACWSNDIPNPGDYTVYRIGDHSIVLVRQTDQGIKAFHNVCLHRARQLCDGPGHAQHLRCSYHGFTWNLNGTLKEVPCRWDFPQVSNDAFRLPEVRVEQWNGFAFINLDGKAPPLAEYLEDIPAHFEAWDFSDRFKAVHVEKIVHVNWKVCMEAFLESLHTVGTHPQLLPFNAETLSQYDVYPGKRHFDRTINPMGFISEHIADTPFSEQEIVDSFVSNYYPQYIGTEHAKVAEGSSARKVLAALNRRNLEQITGTDLSEFGESEMLDGVWYTIFPNFVPWPTYGVMLVYRFRPLENDPERCVWDIMVLMPFRGERPASVPVRRVEENEKLVDHLGALGGILDQDCENLRGVRVGLRAAVKPRVTLSQYQESRIRHLNQTLDEYICG